MDWLLCWILDNLTLLFKRNSLYNVELEEEHDKKYEYKEEKMP